MKVLLLGVGMQGKAALHDLVNSEAVQEIVAADQEYEALKTCIESSQYSDKVRCEHVDAESPESIAHLMAQGPDVTSDILQRLKAALESLDIEELVFLHAEEFVFEDVSSNEMITAREELRMYYRQFTALPGVKFSDVSFFLCEDKVAGEWTWSGIKPSSGAEYSVRGASIIELRDGKIGRETIYYDPRPALP